MKRLNLVCLLLVSMAAIAPTAKADNPVNWNFNLETYGGRYDYGPLSPPIDAGYPQYEYEFVLIPTEIQDWWGTWYELPVGAPESNFGVLEPIPFADELVNSFTSDEVCFDILASIDSSGYGTVSIDNVTFGYIADYPVTGFKCSGYMQVTPEPTTIVLLGLGSLVLLKKRRS